MPSTAVPTCWCWARSGADLGANIVFTAMDEDARGQIFWEIEGEDAARLCSQFQLASAGPTSRSSSCSGTRPTTRLRPTRTGTTFTGLPWLPGTATARWTHRPLTVFVDNVEEMGKVTLLDEQPLIGKSITAAVEDTDRSVAIATWQWMRATSTASTFNVIPGATTATYTLLWKPMVATTCGPMRPISIARATKTTLTR